MNLEIMEVANGWVVRPSSFGYTEGALRPLTEMQVFNSFADMTVYLRAQSKILNTDKSNAS